MNLKDKLKGFPPIRLLTLDERPDRVEYTESQYDYWGIKDYTICSGSKYQLSTYQEWKNSVILNPFDDYETKDDHIKVLSITVSYLETIKNWLETTNEKYCLLMEDDYDLGFIEYWHFDWQYLMNRIPYDWDCIQISFENPYVFPCFLHPILSGHSCGASLINRRYAEKLISLHYKEGKIDLSQKVCNYMASSTETKGPNVTIDYLLGHNGKTYCLPLISINQDIGSYAENICRKEERLDLQFSYKCYQKWWIELRDDYTLEEFFIYGKLNDKFLMNRTSQFFVGPDKSTEGS